MSYLVPGPPDERTRQAIRSVSGLMEVADEEREDLAIQQQANIEDDREWEMAHGADDGSLDSPQTTRILDTWREQRQRGADEGEADFYMADTDSDDSLLADLPGASTPEERARADAARMNTAVESVAQRLHSGTVTYGPGDEVEAVPLSDYRAFDDECLGDFPTDAAPPRPVAPQPTPVDRDDDGYDAPPGDSWLRTASEPPPFDPSC